MPRLLSSRHSAPPRPAKIRGARGGRLTITALALIAACGGDAPTGSAGPLTPREGSLAIAVAGLPATASAHITVTGPAGFSRSLSGAATLSVAPGEYQVTADDVTAGADRYAPLTAQQPAIVSSGGSSAVTVGYALASGMLALSASGLPDGALGAVVVTGPSGFVRRVTLPDTLRGLTAGTYTLVPESLVANGGTWAPASARLELSVAAGANATPATIAYALASGALQITADGLPDGASATALLSGPNGYSRPVATGDTVPNLLAGTYTLTATSVTVGSDAYQPPPPVDIVVTPSLEPRPASLRFTLSTGRLEVAVSGVPGGAAPRIDVTGPGGFARALGGSATLSGLTPGEYTVTATDIETAAASYSPSSATQKVTVNASTAAATTTLSYRISTGSIALVVSGLPGGAPGSAVITGPGGYSLNVTGTLTVTKLKPGSYTVTAAQVNVSGVSYAPAPTAQSVIVSASLTAAPAVITYGISAGALSLTVGGLPNGVNASVSIAGPGGFSRTATASALYLDVTPGSYTVTAQSVSSGGSSYAPTQSAQTIAVAASQQPTSATVTYVVATGALTVNVSGLPGGANAAVTVSGPSGYSRTLNASTAITGLLAGTYAIAAANVTSGGTTYAPSSASQSASVTAGSTSTVAVAYAAIGSPSTLNLTIDALHVQQVVQSYSGGVPLVAGRDGLLRVFVKANASNSVAPAVRLRFYNGATLTSTVTLNAPVASVPTTITEGTLGSSWNYTVPGALLQPGVKVLADVDPTNAIAESSDVDNAFPANGTPLALDVRSVPTFSVRLVPVLQSVNGLQGGVSNANLAQYLADTRKLYPLGTVDADVRAPFTTNAPALQSGDGNGAWMQVLSEVSALRAADGSARNYFGIVKVSYFSGIAGLGYVPGRAAIGWDYLPSAAEVVAHELGHNFGRNHAPCGGAGGPDPAFPYAGGTIGVYGYDIASNTLKAPSTSDLMGYCGSPWISDYNYKAVLDYRAGNPFVASAFAGSSSHRGLLVWGRVQNGQVVLEPAYEVDAPASLPTPGGSHHLEAFDALGRRLLDVSFDGEKVADIPGGGEHFAFVVPLTAFGGNAPERLRLTSGGRRVEQVNAPASSESPAVRRLSGGRVEVTWSDASTRGMLVRDGKSGEILAFGRNGRVVAYSRSGDLDLAPTGGIGAGRRQRVKVQ